MINTSHPYFVYSTGGPNVSPEIQRRRDESGQAEEDDVQPDRYLRFPLQHQGGVGRALRQEGAGVAVHGKRVQGLHAQDRPLPLPGQSGRDPETTLTGRDHIDRMAFLREFPEQGRIDAPRREVHETGYGEEKNVHFRILVFTTGTAVGNRVVFFRYNNSLSEMPTRM